MMDILFFETGLNRLGWAGCWGRCPRGEKLCWGGDGRCWVLRGEWGSKGMLGYWKSLLGRDGGDLSLWFARGWVFFLRRRTEIG